jgi:hypothetical protein
MRLCPQRLGFVLRPKAKRLRSRATRDVAAEVLAQPVPALLSAAPPRGVCRAARDNLVGGAALCIWRKGCLR